MWLASFGGIAAAEYLQDPQVHSIGGAAKAATTAAGIYFGVLCTSILAHRVFYHRLRKVCFSHV